MTLKSTTYMERLIENINILKKEKNAVILVHNYQRPEIYEVADFLGDSLELAKKAANTDADIIVFCGVDFMSEAAKILNPDKLVLHPDKMAMCPMANMVTAEQVLEYKKKFPKAAVVSYINTTSDVKAVSDICCTSANSVKVVNSLEQDQVIFTPDKNLAAYTQTQTDKKIIPLEGYCYVHDKILPEEITEAKKAHPKAEVMAHPECTMEVLALSDAVCSTSQMIKHAKQSNAREFIVATECGMAHRLKLEVLDKNFYPLPKTCVQMKKITMQKVYDSLAKEQYRIEIDKDVMDKARKALQRMLDVS